MKCYEVNIGTDATRGGTVQTRPINGRVVHIRIPKDAPVLLGGSADITITRANDGGTVGAFTNAPTSGVEYSPTIPAQSNSGGSTAYAAGFGPVPAGGYPVDGHLNVVVLQGAVSGAGTAFVYVEGS